MSARMLVVFACGASFWLYAQLPRREARGHRPPPNTSGANDVLARKWWTDPAVIRGIGLSDEQQRRIDQVFRQNRLQLIDLRAVLEKEEAILEPLLAADPLQESAVLSQIDRVAAARSELEKANARMLFGFRLLLTTGQWKELQSPDGHPRTALRPGPVKARALPGNMP